MSGIVPIRSGEYADRGDYHRTLDPSWEFYPTYIAKLKAVRRYLDALPATARVLDAGCGEGILVEEYRGKLAITGVDANYASEYVTQASLMALPFPDGSFDHALCLDVLEHLAYEEQPRALAEIHRVLRPGGQLFVSAPNLAHLQSRIQFLLRGRLIRTASEFKHPGDRPLWEYRQLARRAGFELIRTDGIFPTIPVVTHFIRRNPRALAPLHRLLTRLLPIPGWCFLNLLTFRRA